MGEGRCALGHDGGRERRAHHHRSGKDGGLACIRDLRVPVTTVLGQLGAGPSAEEMLADYPHLEAEDILEAKEILEATDCSSSPGQRSACCSPPTATLARSRPHDCHHSFDR